MIACTPTRRMDLCSRPCAPVSWHSHPAFLFTTDTRFWYRSLARPSGAGPPSASGAAAARWLRGLPRGRGAAGGGGDLCRAVGARGNSSRGGGPRGTWRGRSNRSGGGGGSKGARSSCQARRGCEAGPAAAVAAGVPGGGAAGVACGQPREAGCVTSGRRRTCCRGAIRSAALGPGGRLHGTGDEGRGCHTPRRSVGGACCIATVIG